jgi:hypothetical protein
MYMQYRGRAVEASGWLAEGCDVPILYLGDQGEHAGDLAVVDNELVEWDGRGWTAPRLAAERDGALLL